MASDISGHVFIFLGAAYILTTSDEGLTWTQAAKLLAFDGAANDEFGRAVAVSGDTVVVGGPNNDGNAGSTLSAPVN